jgi:hypothetical protein
MIGRQAQTPVWSGPLGRQHVGRRGRRQPQPGAQQPVNQALWTLVYNWFQIELDTSVIAQASGQSAQSIIGGKDLEIQGAVENQKHQMTRMIVTNGDGIVAALATTASANTVLGLVNAAAEGTAYGYSALVRGWLFPGQPVDIGTTGDTDALDHRDADLGGRLLQPGGADDHGRHGDRADGGHALRLHPQPELASAPNPELNGLRQIIGNGALGGLNPATAGQEYWRGAFRDTTTTTFSLDLPLNLQRYILQNSNEPGSAGLDGLPAAGELLLAAAVAGRVRQRRNLGAGNVDGPTWNGMKVDAFADILDSDWYQLTLSDLVRVKSALDKPTWASDIEGAGGATRWKQGTTRFVDGVVYPMQLGVQRRNTQAGAVALK